MTDQNKAEPDKAEPDKAELDNRGVTVVDCASCDGGGVTSRRCSCTWYGDQLIVSDDQRTTGAGAGGSAYRDCRVCGGTGTTCSTCLSCAGLGRRRAQLVLTVANVDTAAVASVNVVPGALAPVHRDGHWLLDLDAVVTELAARVGAEYVYEPDSPDRDIYAGSLSLPDEWLPDLHAEQRHALEAAAIADRATYPWRVWLGRATRPPRPEPARHLGQLCALAELLCLDLVVETRPEPYGDGRYRWQLRLELPDTDVGDTFAGSISGADSLDAAIVAAGLTGMAAGLKDRSRDAPAHFLHPNQPDGLPIGPPKLDLDQLERRMVADCTTLVTGAPTPGAQAIWRDGRWWHTSLRVVAVVEELTERDTGQIRRCTVDKLARSWQPPPPSWQGPAIPFEPCPYCVPEQGLRRCICTVGAATADPECRYCGGAGLSGRHGSGLLRCFSCGDTDQVRHGVVVTVTDGQHWARHLNWAVPAADSDSAVAPQIGSQPGGKPIHQVPPLYRLPSHLADLAVRDQPVRLAQLTPLDDHARVYAEELWHGWATLDHPGQDPLTAYLANVANGHPGGRVLLLAEPPDAPPLASTLALAYGLGLALVVTVADHRHNAGTPYQLQGVSWGAYFAPPGASSASGAAFGLNAYPDRPALGQALARAIEYLSVDTNSAVPAEQGTPIAVPQSVPTPAVDLGPAPDGPAPGGPASDDLVSLLSLLAAHHAGETVIIVLAASHCEVHVREGPQTVRRVVTAANLPAAVTALRLHPPA
ncbi:hypothetical protein [Micromonospora sp. NBC_01813]|uniref:hypothetical protein n=1 Tax=Micromonospora sp. NBC_01813 TaxID=2975988 RepID=UPI002DDB24D8|nr:hypothetical protein [Micromonospora sp. NBC_01813]WSA08668.1 hypothetical protein OG958_31590 [Micromonospora sp. NBC_01813]